MPEENTQQTQQENTQNDGAMPSFEDWFSKAEEPVKQIITSRFEALENTVRATRSERDALKVEVKNLLKTAEKGSSAETALNDALSKLEQAERRATFLEDAVKPAIGCRNPRAAYALAMSEDLFTKQGQPDWDGLKKIAPELFGTALPKSNGGSGVEKPPEKIDMNSVIRKMAGRE